ncbi:MAG: FtsK/SpoIIIE domain-containing protein [Byssovorax sp.]
MPVELSVKQVREELLRAGGHAEAGDGAPSNRLLGTLFHEIFADLVSDIPGRSGLRIAFEAGPKEAPERLVEHTYRALVGPRLARHQAHLQESTEAVLAFWDAVQHLARWVGSIVAEVIEARRDQPLGWEDLATILGAEVLLRGEIREPGWTDGVFLTGVADAIVRVPERDTFCAVELKLGRAHPAVDLGQAALYRLIASRTSSTKSPPALALLRFSPALEERVIEASDVAEAEARLLSLIARMAGVTPAPRSAAPQPSTPPRSSTPPRASAPPRAPSTSSVAPAPSPAPSPYAELGQRLARALREYGRSVEIQREPEVGPRFLRFEAKLGRGVTFEQVARLTTELRLKVALHKEPIVTKDGGRLCIDVERPDPAVLPFSAITRALTAGPHGSARVPIGVDLSGKLHVADLASPVSAHILAAGTTGSGKTEWLRTAIAGLMIANTPETLRLVLIDPKLLAFPDLRSSPFLWDKHGLWTLGDGDVIEVLDDLVDEMDRRYRLLSAAGADDLERYLDKTRAKLPRIVCFCDEYFALISQGREQRKEIENAIGLLGAKARAAGIHLVIATQQPSRKVIHGPLDANIPCRVGLLTQSAIESRMLLQAPGAERLTGHGDLLYKDVGEPVRLQAPLLSANDRANIFGAR